MEKQITLYRKRFIPMETILLKDDVVIYEDAELLVTKWQVLKPRKDFAKGISCYFLKKGYKISRFLDKEDRLVYDYCDIIETEYHAETNTYLFSDLLADVIIEKNGFVRVIDLAEIADALDQEILSLELAKKALRQLEELLKIVYDGSWKDLVKPYFEMGQQL